LNSVATVQPSSCVDHAVPFLCVVPNGT